MPSQASYLAGEICYFPGLHISQSRDAVVRLPEARVTPVVAEIYLGARSFVLRRPFCSVAKPRPRSADCRQLWAVGGKVRKNSLCAAAQQKGRGRVAFVTSPCSDHQIGHR
ncbi:hypothetical protein NDU88_002017 [Pleurodeles waltl]|uniref:Uncharacterized protein n=1 Tax=Pleurodeles waltl TaxID=8319 RepID=A0AAV7U8G7_PLEWA|nr:hypothetical protein NDU88_002017 [Pleurodeles waltl]